MEERIASRAGGTSTCDTRIEKLSIPIWDAWCTVMAVAGAVVSNPTAKKTTSFEGFSRAILSVSRGE